MFCKKWKYQLVVVLRFQPNQFISQQDWKLMYGFQKNTMSEILMQMGQNPDKAFYCLYCNFRN